MQKTVEQTTLEPIELEVIQMLYGLGSAPTRDTPLQPRMSESEVKEIEQNALRKLRHYRMEELNQLRRAG